MNNILYCILHTKKQEDRYLNIVKTWASDIDYLFYSDHEDITKNIVKMSDRCDYTSAEEKQVNIIHYLINNSNYHKYDWYFFCDNDSYINTKNVNKLLPNLDKNSICGLKANSWPIDPTMFYCGGGAGFIIHRNLLHTLSKFIKVYNSGYSDVTIGLSARSAGIPIKHYDGFNSFPPSYYNMIKSQIDNQISFHYIKSFSEMNTLYENSKSNT